MEAEAIQQLKDELQAAFDSKLERLHGEIATLQKQNEDLIVQKDKKSQSEEVQLQQASMRMQLIQQARLETEKFSVAVQEMAAQVSIKKGNPRCQLCRRSLLMRSKSTNLREPKLLGSGCNNRPTNQDERIARI